MLRILVLLLLTATPALAQNRLTVAPVMVADLRPVFATVESVREVEARARITGTLVQANNALNGLTYTAPNATVAARMASSYPAGGTPADTGGDPSPLPSAAPPPEPDRRNAASKLTADS